MPAQASCHGPVVEDVLPCNDTQEFRRSRLPLLAAPFIHSGHPELPEQIVYALESIPLPQTALLLIRNFLEVRHRSKAKSHPRAFRAARSCTGCVR